MSFGELLTKLAVILTAYSAAKDQIWSVPLAWKIGGTLVAASCLRDASIRWREAIRLMPGFGFWFMVTYLLTGPLMYFLQCNGVTFFRPWEAVFASGMIAMFFRGFMIVCESWSRWIMWLLGFDNKRLDATHRYFQQQRWEWFFGSHTPCDDDPEWPDDSTEPWTVVDGIVVQDKPAISHDHRCRLT